MIRAGDRFVPCDSLGDEIEADGPADGGGLVPVRTSRGVTLTVSQSLLLDERHWQRTGWLGTRPELLGAKAPDHVVPTGAMARKAAKWRPSLVPAGTDEAIARAMQAGIDAGHEEGDWQKREARVFYDATLRHLLDCAADFARRDDVSGLLNLNHALASLAILRNLAAR